MMRWVLAVGFLLWVSELLWLPAVVPPERWQTALWVEATVTQSLPPPMARLAADVEEGYAFALELTKAPFLALAGRDVREGKEAAEEGPTPRARRSRRASGGSGTSTTGARCAFRRA